MKYKKSIVLVFTGCFFSIVSAIVVWQLSGNQSWNIGIKNRWYTKEATADTVESGSCTMNLGKFKGQVVYDREKDYYFLELRGARFPFKSSPIKAQEIPLEASGRNTIEKNTSLLNGILGKEVMYTTLLINPDEEDEIMPAAHDLARYLQIVNRNKFAGYVYTKQRAKSSHSVLKDSQIQSLEDATPRTPIIQLKGPKSDAQNTAVKVLGDGKVVVEGKTYDELYRAADLICITLLKMLCGSPDCPDAAACASGGKCGCS